MKLSIAVFPVSPHRLFPGEKIHILPLHSDSPNLLTIRRPLFVLKVRWTLVS